jgi:hypothetical protein
MIQQHDASHIIGIVVGTVSVNQVLHAPEDNISYCRSSLGLLHFAQRFELQELGKMF